MARNIAAWVALAVGLLSSPALAESPEPPDPVYKNLRYDDDFSHPDSKAAPDVFGGLKYIPISDGPLGRTYLTIGGEIRERFETYANPNFGIKAPPHNHYLLNRLLLSADLHVTDYFRAFVQFGDLDRFGARGVTSSTDIDRGDIMQAFVDFRAPTPLGDAPTLRLGREELLFGWQRLIAVREGPNVRRTFDGVRFTDHVGDYAFDFLAVRPMVDNQGGFDDVDNSAQKLIGAYLTAPAPFFPALKADLYLLDYENDSAKFRGLTGVEKRQTVGARLFGKAAGFDWNFEGAWQTGSYGALGVRAFLLAGVAGYTFETVPTTPRLSLEANWASGDRGGSTIGTFNAMFPRLPYFGELPLLVPSNVKDIRPVVTLDPVKNVQFVVGYDMLWRASTSDGLYGSGMTLFTGTNGAKVTGSYIGAETSLDLRWRVDQHLTMGGIVSYMTAGPALAQATGKDVRFGVLYAKYKF